MNLARAMLVLLGLSVSSPTAAGLAYDSPSERYPVFRAETEVAMDPAPGFDVTIFHLREPIPDAEATIAREDDRVRFTLTTTRLDRHAYTVWLVVYNFPEFCTDPDTEGGRDFRCGQGDFFNAAAGFSIVYGTGREGSGDGDALETFAGERRRFDLGGVFLGPGLLDPRRAEIHLLLRDDGPCPPDGCGDRTTTFEGGCRNPRLGGALRLVHGGEPGDYECATSQATGY